MASTCVIEPTPEKTSDKTLIVIVNSDGTVSVDPETLQSVLENERDSTVSVVRLGKPIASECNTDPDNEDVSAQVNLTVEGFYSPYAATSQEYLDDGLVLQNELLSGEDDEDSTLSIIDPASDVIHVDHCYTNRLTNRQILQLSVGEVHADIQAQLQEQDGLDNSATIRHEVSSGIRGKAKSRGVRGGKRDVPGRRSVAVLGDGAEVNAPGLQHIALRPPPNSPASATLVPLTMVLPAGAAKQNILQSSNAQVPKGPVKVLVSHAHTSGVSAPGRPGIGTGPAGSGVVLARLAPINMHSQTVVVSENGQIQQQPRLIRIGPDGQVLQQSPQQVVMLVQGDAVGTNASSPSMIASPIPKRGLSHVSVVRSRGRGGLRARGGRGSRVYNRGGRGGIRIHSEPLDQAMEDALNAMTSPEKNEDALTSEADESFPHVKKNKVKIPKFRGEENALHALKTPRTYSKKIEQLQKASSLPVQPLLSPTKEEKSDDGVSPLTTTKVHVIKKAPATPSVAPPSLPTTLPSAPATPVLSSATSASSSSLKKYPRRENRKPPAHLADAFSAELLFSTPDIIRRVSKAPSSTSGAIAVSQESQDIVSAADSPAMAVASAAVITEQVPQISSLEKTDTLAGIEPSLLDTIQTEVSKSEEELLADALLLEDLEGSIPVLEEAAMDSSETTTIVTVIPSSTAESPQAPCSIQQSSHVLTNSSQQSADINCMSKQDPKLGQNQYSNSPDGMTKGFNESIENTEVSSKHAPVEKVDSSSRRKSTEKTAKSPRRKSADIQMKQDSIEQSEAKTGVKLATRRRSSSTKTFTEDDDDNKVGGGVSEEEDDEGRSDDESWNSEDDPDRLWCICKKPHNNRFMICCDDCEDWFHGHCVGVTKAMGKRISEWKCPNCKTNSPDEKRISPKGGRSPRKSISEQQVTSPPPTPPVKIKQLTLTAMLSQTGQVKETETTSVITKDVILPIKVKSPTSKMQSKQHIKGSIIKASSTKMSLLKDNSPAVKAPIVSKDGASGLIKSSKKDVTAPKHVKDGSMKPPHSKAGGSKSSKDVSEKDVRKEISASVAIPAATISKVGGQLCIKCKKIQARPGQMYCSELCIMQYSEETLKSLASSSSDGLKIDQRITVIEKKTGRIFASANGPLASELRSWLLTNPSFEVVQSSPLPNAKYYSTPVAGASNAASSSSGASQTTVKHHRHHSVIKKKGTSATPLRTQAVLEHQHILEQSKAAAVNAEIPMKSSKAKLSFHLPKTPQQSSQGSQSKSQLLGRPDLLKTPTSSVKPNESKQLKQTRLVLHPATPATPSVSAITPTPTPQVAIIKPQQLQRQLSQKSESPKTPAPSTSSSVSSSSSIKIQTSKKSDKRSSAGEAGSQKSERKSSISEASSRKLSTDEGSKEKEKEKEKEKDPGTKVEPIRHTVCKALQETLAARLKDCDDLNPSDESLQKIALSIEEELFSLFKDTGTKYKAKYRSLVFNIKDPKNPSLFRRIAEGSLPPTELVRLSAEELAPQELARWREQQTQHQLEMIRKSELDLLQMAKSKVMKTHKGEQEIETEAVAPVPDIDPNVTVTDLVMALNDSVTSTTVEEAEKIEQRELTLKEREQERREREREKIRRDEEERESSSRGSHHKHHKEKSERHRSRKDKHHSRKKSKSKDRARSRDRGKIRERSRSRSKVRRDLKQKEKERHKGNKDHISRRRKDSKSESQEETSVAEKTEKIVLQEPKKEDIDVSDHEPSSTVTIKTPESSAEDHTWIDDEKAVWEGFTVMGGVARFFTGLVPLIGQCSDLDKELASFIDCVGRISPSMAYDYIASVKKTGTKDIALLRLVCSEENEDQKKSYMKLFSHLSSRNRLGVVQVSSKNIKDFYILPWAKDTSLPPVLSFFDSSSLGPNRPHLLVAIIVWSRLKRLSNKLAGIDTAHTIKAPRLSIEAPRLPIETPRLSIEAPKEPVISAPPKPLAIVAEASERSYTPPPAPVLKHASPPVSPSRSPKVNIPLLGEVDDENVPYSPGEGESDDESERRKAELDRKIMEEQLRIRSLENAIVSLNPNLELEKEDDNDDNKPYSPSRSFTPPNSPPASHMLNSKSLLKVDPIVQNYSALDESPEVDEGPSLIPADCSSSFFAPPPSTTPPLPSSKPHSSKSRDPRNRSQTKSSLSDFSDEDLIRKAEQQLAESSSLSGPPSTPAVPLHSQPPPILSIPPPDMSKPPPSIPHLTPDLTQPPPSLGHMPPSMSPLPAKVSQSSRTISQLPTVSQAGSVNLSQPLLSLPAKSQTITLPPSKFAQPSSALPQPPPPGMEDDPIFFTPSYTTYPVSLPPVAAPSIIPLPPKPASKPPPPPPEPSVSPPMSEPSSPLPRRPQTPPSPASAPQSRSPSRSPSRSSYSSSDSDSNRSQRSRSRSNSCSPSRSPSPPITRVPRPPTPPRTKRRRSSLETEEDIAARKNRDHLRWKDRPPSPAEPEYSREKSSDRSKERTRVRSRDSSRSRSRSNSRDRSTDRSPTRERERYRERDRPRGRNRDRERSWEYRERDRDRWEAREQFSHRDQQPHQGHPGHPGHPSGHPGPGMMRGGRGRGWVERGKFRGAFRGFFRGGGRGNFRGQGRPPHHPHYHGDIQDHSQFEGDIRNFEEKQRERTLKIKRKEMKAKKSWN